MIFCKNITSDDHALLGELGVDTTPDKKRSTSLRDQRIIAGFEEIVQFIKKHDKAPRNEDGNNIFEKLYAVRLKKIRSSPDCLEVLSDFDELGLLNDIESKENDSDMDDDELLSLLGVDDQPPNDIMNLTHVKERKIPKPADDIAQRTPCKDFEKFEKEFRSIQADLDNGKRYTYKYKDNAEIKEHDLFILDGLKARVVEISELSINRDGRPDGRLRIVFENETESNLLLRSLQRALNRDKASRRISFSEDDIAPIFSDKSEEDDLESGSIYVTRSKSDNPVVANNRKIVHKIGVTGGSVKKRISSAKTDPTFLMAEVELVAEYKLFHINRKNLETMIHSVFSNVKLDIEIIDRFGKPYKPQEWFIVPLGSIKQAIELIRKGTIEKFVYDPERAEFVEHY